MRGWTEPNIVGRNFTSRIRPLSPGSVDALLVMSFVTRKTNQITARNQRLARRQRKAIQFTGIGPTCYVFVSSYYPALSLSLQSSFVNNHRKTGVKNHRHIVKTSQTYHINVPCQHRFVPTNLRSTPIDLIVCLSRRNRIQEQTNQRTHKGRGHMSQYHTFYGFSIQRRIANHVVLTGLNQCNARTRQ